MTLAPPPVVEDYFSLTPLIIRLCEEFTACPVKCSSPLDIWHGVEMQRRLHKRAGMLHTGLGA